MFFQPKVIAGCIIGAGIGIPSYVFSGGECSGSYIVIPWDDNLGENNAILECKDESNSKNYSVYLVLKEESRSSDKREATLQVVDNTNKKVVWGPKVESQLQWDRWGIQISYAKVPKEASSSEQKEEKVTEIRAPKNKRWSGGTETIKCQKSTVQMKKNTGEEDEGKCSGAFLQSKHMDFALEPKNCWKGWFRKNICNINLAKKVEWNPNFQPTAVFCNS